MTLVQDNSNGDTNKTDVWELIKNGFFEEACQVADLSYSTTKDSLILRNKVRALLHLKKYEEASSVMKRIISKEDQKNDSDFIFWGIAEWLLGRPKHAIDLWKKGRECEYSDAAGGVELESVLYFASICLADLHLKQDSVTKINQILKRKKSIVWPTPLGSFLVGKIEREKLLSTVSDIPILKQRNLCQAYFVLAIKQLEFGFGDKYKLELENSLSQGPFSYLEQFYYLAKGQYDLLR